MGVRKTAVVPSKLPAQERVRRMHVRWLCLQHLDAVRPDGMTDAALLPLFRNIYPDVSHKELQRELDYLAQQNLLTITRNGQIWHLKLTWQGIDIVEYTSHCPDGIGRPIMPD